MFSLMLTDSPSLVPLRATRARHSPVGAGVSTRPWAVRTLGPFAHGISPMHDRAPRSRDPRRRHAGRRQRLRRHLRRVAAEPDGQRRRPHRRAPLEGPGGDRGDGRRCSSTQPVKVGDEVSVYAEIERVGRTSMTIAVEAWRRARHRGGIDQGDRGQVHLRRDRRRRASRGRWTWDDRSRSSSFETPLPNPSPKQATGSMEFNG